MDALLGKIRNCKECEPHLPLGANPVLTASPKSKLVIIGQAPGRIVHQSGIPWDDKSGDNLRAWLGIDKEVFYNPEIVALIPMGFCYPGTGKSGDLPPRPECAPLWHKALLQKMNPELILLIGNYAQKYYLGKRAEKTLTATVKNFRNYLPKYFPLPHPSPRNNIWQAKNPWFREEVLSALEKKVNAVLEI
ncbi:MAG: uracil-DNA glycosylase family protein [Chitinophagales bacterium]